MFRPIGEPTSSRCLFRSQTGQEVHKLVNLSEPIPIQILGVTVIPSSSTVIINSPSIKPSFALVLLLRIALMSAAYGSPQQLCWLPTSPKDPMITYL